MITNYKLLVAAGMLSLATVAANADGVYGYNMDGSTTDYWVALTSGGGITVTAADNVVTVTNNNNSRMAYNVWGSEVWEEAAAANSGTDNYYVGFNFKVQPGGQVTYTTVNDTIDGVVTSTSTYAQQGGYEIRLTGAPTTEAQYTLNWWSTGTGWTDYVFKMTETSTVEENPNPTTAPTFYVNNDSTQLVTLDVTSTYTFEMMTDTTTRSTTVTISLDGISIYTSTYTIADDVTLLPQAMILFLNRGSVSPTASFAISNLRVGKWVETELAQDPKYTLSTVSGTNRMYTFTFNEGETLHYTADQDVYPGSDPEYTATSGTFSYDQIALGEAALWTTAVTNVTIWTTLTSDATVASNEVTFTSDADAIKLPTPEVEIVGVNEGYDKTYQVTIDNSEVPTNPDITYSYTYGDQSGENMASGTTISVTGSGTLKITAVLYGFTDSDVLTVVNNTSYKISQDLDFEHMTADELTALGFTALDPIQTSTMSGENNWTARLYLYDYIVEGTDTTLYYGPNYVLSRKVTNGALEAIADGAEYPIVERYDYANSTLLSAVDSATVCALFPPLMPPNSTTGYTKANTLQVKLGIGLLNNETVQNYVPYYIRGIGDEDFALVYKISGYGSNSTHGYFSSIDEAKASYHGELTDVIKGNGEFELYRIDTAISRILIMSVDEENPISNITADVEDDPNAPIYNLQGIRVSKENLTRGMYIQNGKKFLVK